MALKDVTPYTAGGEAGVVHILDAQHVERWVEEQAQELLDLGYVRVAVTPHRFGGRQWRWFTNDAARLREEMRG